ncbi:transmembrane protein 223 [Copidosoma floridanum]|uniref:transmembrane protein 223 n=1 Tax=Copidosoma floridanum TaxID=29053 RepID=UPI0006C9D1A4|nr:transmembrane protein 223 [Copidosoma floridanum]
MFGAVVGVSRLHLRICPKCDNFAVSRIFKPYAAQGFVNKQINQLPRALRNFSNWKSPVLNKSCWRTYIIGWNQFSKQVVSKSNALKRFESTGTASQNNPLRINTKIKNNVMLYRLEKDIFIRGSLLFGIVAMIGCLFMADSVYMVLCKDLFNPTIPWKTRLYDNIFPVSAVIIGILAGPLILTAVWFITVRTVKYVVLHKGGENVTIVTYHPLFNFKKMTVPLSHVDCKTSRTEAKSYAMIKLKEKKYQFLIDKTGTFVNPELFDCTVGASRA